MPSIAARAPPAATARQQGQRLRAHLAIGVHELLGKDAKALGAHQLILGMDDQKIDAQVLAGGSLLDKATMGSVALGIVLLAFRDLCLGLFELAVTS